MRNDPREPDWAGLFRAILISAVLGGIIWAGIAWALWAIFH